MSNPTQSQNSIKGAYIIRDTIKALGTNEIKPATFGIFYDALDNLKASGTQHTLPPLMRFKANTSAGLISFLLAFSFIYLRNNYKISR